jgi:hypothetical protein
MSETATPNVKKELAALERMTGGQLQRRYAEVFGEPARSGNRQWLYRRVAWRLQALAEGGLTERARTRARELARDADVRLRPPPGLSVAPAPAALRTVSGRVTAGRDRRLPAPGTVLRREFKGQQYRVTVLPGGFEHDGRTYRSLSAVAHAITGSHWNGYLFFGLAGVKEDR